MHRREKGERSLLGRRRTLHREKLERTEQERGKRCRRRMDGKCWYNGHRQYKKQEANLKKAVMELEYSQQYNVWKCLACKWYHIGRDSKYKGGKHGHRDDV